jgi:hypothetical protein
MTEIPPPPDQSRSLAAAFAELRARLRGVDADLLEIDPTDPDTLANGASFTVDTDAGPVHYLNDVPGAGEHAELRSRAVETTAPASPSGSSVWMTSSG